MINSIDVPVAIIFFNRPDLLAITFESVKTARPNKLFLIQDGARKNNQNDFIQIEKCQKIVSKVDWPCEVFKNFSDINLGCGMRVFSGISWAFQFIDRLIILEDDCVPSKSFFLFCEELLEKYKNDERIDMISGMNHLGIYERTPNDYFFSQAASPWGWATWKRVWITVDYNMSFLNDQYIENLLKLKMGKNFVTEGKRKKQIINDGKKLSSWTYQKGVSTIINSRLVITPKCNLITNIGLSSFGTNTPSILKMIPKGMRRIYFLKSHEINQPLKHPNNFLDDIYYKKKVDRLMGNGYPIVLLYRIIESTFYRLIFGDLSGILKSIKKRYLKLLFKTSKYGAFLFY